MELAISINEEVNTEKVGDSVGKLDNLGIDDIVSNPSSFDTPYEKLSRAWYRPNILNNEKDEDSSVTKAENSELVSIISSIKEKYKSQTLLLLALNSNRTVSEKCDSMSEISANDIHNCQNSSLLMNNSSTNQYEYNNDFRFNFENKYDPVVEQKLYPKFYHSFKFDGDFVFQRTGSSRTVCLTCRCELLMQRSNRNIVSHLSGQQHMSKLSNSNNVTQLRNYHDIFYNLEPNLQAHQVFFVPDDDPIFVKCVLCCLYVKRYDVPAHIMNDPHKSNIKNLAKDINVKYSFYLLDHHLATYGLQINDDKAMEENQLQIHTPIKNGIAKGTERKVVKNGLRKNPEVHEIVKSVESPNDSNPLNKLPRRFSAHRKFLTNTESSIICTACKKGKNHLAKKDIQLHLVQSSHLVATKLPSLNHIYFCEICDMKFHDEMAWHLHFTKGPNRHGNMAPSRKDKVFEHECLTCNVIIYGDTLSLRRHQNSFIRRTEKKKVVCLSEETKKYFSSKTVINENGQKLFDDAQKVLDVKNEMDKCLQDLENALSCFFKHCKAYPFGSRISGLGSSDSDLDVFIDIGGMYEGIQKQDEQNQFEIIRASLEMFRKKKEFYKITSRPTARTPIIKLKHRPTELDCDISFRHGLSVENTKFLRFCFELQPAAQKLILLLKKWSHLCQLNENITTYAFAMLAIFYLQRENYLISIKTLKELNPTTNIMIDGWETIAYTKPMAEIREYVKTFKGDVVELLEGFFKYYAGFKYNTDIVCPLLGETIPKTRFTEDLKGSKLPKEMATYIRKINIEAHPEYFRSLSEFCVQDPFDLSHNLTKACTLTIVEKFKKLCALSHEMVNKFKD